LADVGPSALTVPPTWNGRTNSQWRSVSLRLLLAALVLLAGACRSLPDTREALARPIPRQATFEGSAGPVSTEGSERIIGKLGYRDQGTAALEQHLAFSHSARSRPRAPSSTGSAPLASGCSNSTRSTRPGANRGAGTPTTAITAD